MRLEPLIAKKFEMKGSEKSRQSLLDEDMAEASDKKGILLQNLQDAGFDIQTIQQCISLVDKKQEAQLLRLLAYQKNRLLDMLHKNQEKIDCLDFLVYQIKHGNII